MKTLGVIFDQHLRWDKHVEHVATSMAKACGALCRLRDGLPLKLRLCCITPYLFLIQVIVVLYGGQRHKIYSDVISFTNKKALRHVACIFYDSHTSILFSKLNVLPFHYNYQFNISMKYK